MPEFDIGQLAAAGVTGPLLVLLLVIALFFWRGPKIISSLDRFIDNYRKRSHAHELALKRLETARAVRAARAPKARLPAAKVPRLEDKSKRS